MKKEIRPKIGPAIFPFEGGVSNRKCNIEKSEQGGEKDKKKKKDGARVL